MSFFIILCFIVVTGLGLVAYLLASEKKPIPQPSSLEQSAVQEVEEIPHQQEWTIRSLWQEFNNVRDKIRLLDIPGGRPGKTEQVKAFFSHVVYAYRLIMQEKEIITFAVLQWSAIAVGYYLWVQMLDWIPPEVWKSAAESDDGGSIADGILIAWSFVCVGVAAFPLSIFSACMGAVHFLRRQGKPSTIAACLNIVLPKAWSLWIFQWIDGWITVRQILIRLPKKRDRMNSWQKARGEALYFAWKLGTIGILPSLITGRGLVESCQQSILVVRHKAKEAVALRGGYSVLCWIVGIASYLGTIVFFHVFEDLLPRHKEMHESVYTFYFWAAVPILVAVGIIQLFLRPIYVIASCDIFSDYLDGKNEKVILPVAPSKSKSALVGFIILVIILIIIFLYRHELGVMNLLSIKYH